MTVVPPRATYRLQFDPAHLDLEGGARLVPYLEALGVSHVFSSPLLASRPGSTHGYDVVDPTRVDDELGGRRGLTGLSTALAAHGMKLVLDIVPNHMAIGRHDPWWMEVLRLGAPTAPHGRHFDIHEPDQPLLLPVLAEPYAEALTEGRLSLVREGGEVLAAYGDERFPLAPGTLPGDADLDTVNRDPDRLHTVFDGQHYRLASWRLSAERLGHRRFFTVTELVGIRQEIPEVFDDTHALVRELIADGTVDGLRIDHIDGLRDPEGYLARLAEASGGAYVVVEKILGAGEELPASWEVAGTTGYEYLEASGRLFVDPEGHQDLLDHYGELTGALTDFDLLAYEERRFVLLERLGAETTRLGARLEALAGMDRWARDILPSELRGAAVEVIASMPVYRTYAREGRMPPEQAAHVEQAVRLAAERNPDRSERVLAVLRRLLALDDLDEAGPDEREAWTDVVEGIQQLTGAVMAKGVEDTAFYRYNVLLSLNEVGGHPSALPSDPVAAYHARNSQTAEHRPSTMTATSTHDTKRSEDVRARISALSGIAEAWTVQVDTWHERNLVHRSPSGVPSPSEELFVYQTLVGAWPLERDEEFGRRIADHLVKALREAKVHTAWLQPDEQHESEVTAFAAALLDDPDFVADLERFAGPVWRAGALDSLAQVALRLLAPGVPDIYQGSELWDLSLTDPDNRRPVDWDRRIAALAELAARAEEGPALVADLADRWTDGVIKLHVTRTGLELRRRDPELYAAGAYLPLAVAGPRAAHVVAFGRARQGRWAIAVAPRLTSQFAGRRLWAQEGWDGTVVELPEGAPRRWLEALTGVEVEGSGRIEVPAVFGLAPVGLLRSVGDPHPPPDRADDGDDARRPKG